ncbi:Fic/DOC family N-terminal domain-containing protein [Ectothiorhodospira sp. 9905]|uniref:Fic/DOC family N-terminal domain-containing protein n=1 Tax=unclassified Ectothiorhodospira TaxID=2684909 RepID=UPI00351CDBAA
MAAIPNASVLLSPLTTQEAVLSSRIEGTQATMGEGCWSSRRLEAMADVDPIAKRWLHR